MNKEELFRTATTPIDSSAFAAAPVRFKNREYMNIMYRTDHDALKKILPEPLEPIDDQVKFEFIKMPDASALGSYTESGQVIPVKFNGKVGEFYLAMYVNNGPAIASGREVAAFPKKYGQPKIYVDSDTLVGQLKYGSLPVANATMGYNYYPMEFTEAKKELTVPSFRLNMMRNYDGSLRICEMTESQITDIKILGAWNNPTRLQLFEHIKAPVADLPVKEIISGAHIIADLSLDAPKAVYNYLDEE